jgi:cation:H+ antiporter
MRWVELAFSLAVVLAGAEIFTNGVEWTGEGFGLSEGVVGSVLAAIGTALPETTIPFVAILSGHRGGDEIGTGAILGAPLMLSTIAMCLLGASVLGFGRRGRRSSELRPERDVVGLDLGYFMVAFSLTVIAGIWHVRALHWALAGALVVGYGFYVRRHFRIGGEREEEREAVGEVRPLYLLVWWRRIRGQRSDVGQPPVSLSIAQMMVGLGVIVGGARIFVSAVEVLAARLGVPSLPFSLLIAPIATELPELFNSVLWIRRGKDTLAMANVTGAMVFQSTFPVSIGLVFTSWRLTGDGLIAGVVALGATGVVLLTLRVRHGLNPKLLVLQATLFAAYVTYVLLTL